jgi:hypothetical protein
MYELPEESIVDRSAGSRSGFDQASSALVTCYAGPKLSMSGRCRHHKPGRGTARLDEPGHRVHGRALCYLDSIVSASVKVYGSRNPVEPEG